MSLQIIENNGRPEWAVVPYQDYLELVDQAEMLQDIRDYDASKTALDRGEEELVPAEIVYALLDGENTIRVWREYRGMSQQTLAEAAAISVQYLSHLEAGKRRGSTRVMAALARALRVSLDDIVPV